MFLLIVLRNQYAFAAPPTAQADPQQDQTASGGPAAHPPGLPRRCLVPAWSGSPSCSRSCCRLPHVLQFQSGSSPCRTAAWPATGGPWPAPVAAVWRPRPTAAPVFPADLIAR